MPRKVVYVAGPISKGDLAENVSRAHEAGVQLLKAGLSPIVPHGNCFWGNLIGRVGPMLAFVPEAVPWGTTLQDWYSMDLPIVGRCDAVLRLPGESAGADLDVAEAERLGLPVFTSAAEVLIWAARSAA